MINKPKTDQNYDQQAKDTLFQNRLLCLLYLVSSL